MNELYYCTDQRVSQVHQHIVLLEEKYLHIFFLNSSIKSLSITQDFSSFSEE